MMGSMKDLLGGETYVPPYQSHSETSKAAATAFTSRASTERKRVKDFLVSRLPGGATDEQMQTALEMNPSTQRPRRVELVNAGVVEDSGEKIKTKSGRPAVVWRVKVAEAA